MKRIAIFNCHQAGERCTGSGCFRAFNGRDAFFARYGGEPIELAAFVRCNGCGRDWENDDALARKIDRLGKIADAVHFGACTVKKGTECAFITRLGTRLEEMGLEVVRGTHAAH